MPYEKPFGKQDNKLSLSGKEQRIADLKATAAANKGEPFDIDAWVEEELKRRETERKKKKQIEVLGRKGRAANILSGMSEEDDGLGSISRPEGRSAMLLG
jgi:hypothetical protein